LAERVIERHAFARAGLLGNPSDGYFGRALSVAVHNFRATVTVEKSPELRIASDGSDDRVFSSVADLAESVTRDGYHGDGKLVQATIKRLFDYCGETGLPLPTENLTVRYRSSIPRQVGLAGSSAIVTATLRALMAFFELDVPKEQQANLVMWAETQELGITAGLQDRVTQVYEGLVYMDLARDVMEREGHGTYESLDPSLLPTMFVAYRTESTKVSGQVLSDLRTRWEQGDREARDTLAQIANLASEGKEALLRGQQGRFAALMNANFDLRRRIMHVDDWDVAVVDAARTLGASAKLAGSGGAIVGAFAGAEPQAQLSERLSALGARVIVAETVSAHARP
jgi:glucuronokinase